MDAPATQTDSMTVKAPLATATLAMAVALFGLWFAYVSYTWGDKASVAMGIGFAAFAIGVARVAQSPRLIASPEGLAFPRDLFTRRNRFLPWDAITEATFVLQTAFAWPVLVLQVRGKENALHIRFPLVGLEKRAQMMALIQRHVCAARTRSKAKLSSSDG